MMRGLTGEATRLLLAGLLGAAAAFFLDPERGRRRRHMTRDRTVATVRRGGLRLARLGRTAAAQVTGRLQALRHRRPVTREEPNDATLAHKVESELFRDPTVPKDRINISAEHGIVVLRGEVDQPEQIEALATTARAVPGVAEVQNLLHLPNTPAPNKHAALEHH